jgi:putative transposase
MKRPARIHILQAFRYAVDPTPAQERACRSHLGARRFAFNWGLALVKTRLDARLRGDPVRVPYTLAALRREWNRAKGTVAPWWQENSKEAYSAGLDGLARALKNYFASRAGERSGPPVGFPAFRKKSCGRQAVRFTTGAIRVEDRTYVVLPRIGRLRTHEPTTALLERIEAGTARILSAALSFDGGRWHVSFTCEAEREVCQPSRPHSIVGVDGGIRHLAVLSTGETVANPRPMCKAHRRIARLSRQLARRRRGSQRWRKTRWRLTRAHARVAHIRRDAMHKLTTTLARTHGTIVVERLNVSGMLQNRRLARALADAGLAEIRRQLGYKCSWYGSALVEAPTFFSSSKTCSRCGAAKTTLPLSERVFRCEACGWQLDRDVNAARNLAALAAAQIAAGSGPEAQNARGRDVRPKAAGQARMNREAGSGSPHQTGTPMP